MNRRNFLGLIPAAGAAFGASKAIAEDDPQEHQDLPSHQCAADDG